MPAGATLVVFFLAFAALVFAATRGRELFMLSVRRGELLVVRGRLPSGLFLDLADVVERAGVARGEIRVAKSEGHARLTARGVDAATLQRLRNTVGIVPLRKLEEATWPQKRNFGQRLGIAWLAWRLR